MKKLLMLTVLAAATCFAAETKKKDAYDIRPAAAKTADAPTSVEWEKKNDALIAAATAPDVLAGFVRSDIAALGLLREVKTGFQTDPMKAVQIAAVSQYVMRDECTFAFLAFWRHSADDEREIWTAALLDAALSAKDPDVAIFMLDQLRWCGYAEQADAIDAKTEGGRAAVREMGDLVAAELRAAGARGE